MKKLVKQILIILKLIIKIILIIVKKKKIITPIKLIKIKILLIIL